MSLLITWRSRQVPASGAKVSPVRRPFWSCPAAVAAVLAVDDAGHDIRDPGEVRGGQRRERDLVVAGASEALGHHRADLLGGPLAHRPGDHAGLAEPAAPRAAPEHLDVQPVVHHLGQGHQLAARVGPVGEVGDGPLLHHLGRLGPHGLHGDEVGAVVAGLVGGGHVHPGQAAERAQDLPPVAAAGALPVAHHLGDLRDRLLAVAEDDDVEEVGDGLRVVGAVAARDDQRVLGPAIGGSHGHAGEVHAVQQVGVGELRRQVERQQVEGAGGTVGVDAEQRHPGRPQLGLEVHPRGVGPLGERVGALVEDLVEDLQALVGQADLVGVRVDEQPGDHVAGGAGAAPVRLLRPVLAADVPRRLLDPGQQGLESLPEWLGLVDGHGGSTLPAGRPRDGTPRPGVDPRASGRATG
jgi:hypothetical protein